MGDFSDSKTGGGLSNLKVERYHPTTGHPPAGTMPDEILPEGTNKPLLFTPVTLPFAGQELKNRVIVSPMCQYSVEDGMPTPYHLAHLGSFALHGAGTIMVEASAVESRGRITPYDLGIWKDEQIAAHADLVRGIKSFSPGLTFGIQIAHAGRKASTWSPFYRGDRHNKVWVTKEEEGWPEDVVGPSAIPYAPDTWLTPKALSAEQIESIEESFVQAARRSYAAGYDFVEIHSAHGYLLHSFLSPLSNSRTDSYGGPLENRSRLLLAIVKRIRAAFPTKGLWVRVSATDFAEHLHEKGQATWEIEGTKQLARLLDAEGVDILDISAGGLVSDQRIKPGPGYQLDFARAVSEDLRVNGSKALVGAVGMMESADAPGGLAEEALHDGKADLILLARGMMAEPAWVEHASVHLTGVRCAGAPQYHRVHPAKRKAAASL